ncbi:MAG: PaaI family thioesterase [Acidobacteriota bacterium]|nr:PaaI family thioesterase [Acidobacteriota bacterium]
MSEQRAFQDDYPDDFNHCYGCGQLNPEGLRIRTYWDGETTLTRYTPRACHTAIPGYVYGGLIASLIDCHGTASAAAAACRRDGRPMDASPRQRFVTASLKVDYLRPTPLGPELELRGRITDLGRRRITVEVELSAAGRVTARGTVVAAALPENWGRGGTHRKD